jgi:hypothetical protein
MNQVGKLAGVNAPRRRVLGALAALAMTQCFPLLAFAASRESTAVADDLDVFIRLSSIVTGVERLDRETAKRIRELISAEPWGKEHLAQIGAKLLPSGQPLPATRAQLLAPERFTDGERWFIGHLLTTWFTGIYYHQRGNHVVTYRNALMHVALEDVRPVPGHCEGQFGFWSEPPAGIGQ